MIQKIRHPSTKIPIFVIHLDKNFHHQITKLPNRFMHHFTPLFRSFEQSTRLDKEIYYKMECFQPSGSFKLRGVGRLCLHKAQEGIRKFVIASGGNAGLAVAYTGQQMGLPVTVVVPESTKENMRQRIRSLGANLEVVGENWNAAHEYTLGLAEAEDTYYVHPFDHPQLWAGHASLVHELREDMAEAPDLILVSVGGGGLFCGIMQGLEEVGWKDTQVLCMETYGAASLAQSMEAGKQITLEKIDTIATSLGAKRVADQAWAYAQREQVHASRVSDLDCLEAMRTLLEEYKVLVEPACGAALAALYQNHPLVMEAQRIVVVVCGGSGASLKDLI
jgi:L-serine/L-threonine ammonia-lyase